MEVTVLRPCLYVNVMILYHKVMRIWSHMYGNYDARQSSGPFLYVNVMILYYKVVSIWLHMYAARQSSGPFLYVNVIILLLYNDDVIVYVWKSQSKHCITRMHMHTHNHVLRACTCTHTIATRTLGLVVMACFVHIQTIIHIYTRTYTHKLSPRALLLGSHVVFLPLSSLGDFPEKYKLACRRACSGI